MIKAIVEELNKIVPSYNLESFKSENAFLIPSFVCVDIGEKEAIGRFSHQTLFVYLYAPIDSYQLIFNLKNQIEKALHKKKLAKKKSEGYFWIEYNKLIFSKIDKTLSKRCVCLEFKIPAV